MGIVGFKWGDKELTLLMNRDNTDTMVINEANWVEDVLGSRSKQTEGTWFGVTRGGRVAFLLDPMLWGNIVGSERIPIKFLNSNLSPDVFAGHLEKEEEENHSKYDEEDDDEGLRRAYELIVADITSGSMVYIGKPDLGEPTVIKKTVAFGVHTLSLDGLDSNTFKDLRLRRHFNAMLVEYNNKELPEMHELAARFMYDTTEAHTGHEFTALFLDMISELRAYDRYGTTSTTAFVVDNKKRPSSMRGIWRMACGKRKASLSTSNSPLQPTSIAQCSSIYTPIYIIK